MNKQLVVLLFFLLSAIALYFGGPLKLQPDAKVDKNIPDEQQEKYDSLAKLIENVRKELKVIQLRNHIQILRMSSVTTSQDNMRELVSLRKYVLSKEPLIRILYPGLLNILFLSNGTGAEVGVYLGDFSKTILEGWKGVLLLVDPWADLDEWKSVLAAAHKGNWESVYKTAQLNVKPFRDRALFIRNTSVNAVMDIPDGSLDFVYIDGDHSYEGCKKDLEVWFPKVSRGGLFSGHDYLNNDPTAGFAACKVKKAVDEFSTQKRLTVFPGMEDQPSWYMIKE